MRMVKWLLQEMNTAARVQILDQGVCISHNANILGKGSKQQFFLNVRVNSRVDWGV